MQLCGNATYKKETKHKHNFKPYDNKIVFKCFKEIKHKKISKYFRKIPYSQGVVNYAVIYFCD